jgi:hypothetical protein
MPLYKLFSTARSYSSSMIKKIFTPHGNIFYRYNFTHASPILCSKSLHLHLYFLGSHLYIYKWFYIFYFLFSGYSYTTFFIGIHCANNTRPYHTIIFHTTNFYLTFRDYCGINLLLRPNMVLITYI